MQKWPLKSELDPAVYGPPESKITTDYVENLIKVYGYNDINQVHTFSIQVNDCNNYTKMKFISVMYIYTGIKRKEVVHVGLPRCFTTIR